MEHVPQPNQNATGHPQPVSTLKEHAGQSDKPMPGNPGSDSRAQEHAAQPVIMNRPSQMSDPEQARATLAATKEQMTSANKALKEEVGQLKESLYHLMNQRAALKEKLKEQK